MKQTFFQWWTDRLSVGRFEVIITIVMVVVPFFPVLGFWLFGVGVWGLALYGISTGFVKDVIDYREYCERHKEKLMNILKSNHEN